jgi:uncharacterized protein
VRGLVQRARARCRDVLRAQRARIQHLLGLTAEAARLTVPGGSQGPMRRGAPVPLALPATVGDADGAPTSVPSFDVGRARAGRSWSVVWGRGALAGWVEHDGRTPRWVLFGLGVALIAWSLVANWVIGDAGYTIRNLLLTAAGLLGARSAGLGNAELGLARDRVGAGLRWGGGAAVVTAAVIGAGIVFAELLPGVAALLADERAQLQGAALTTAVLVRIPFGTALFEEFVFRGVLLAVFLRGTTPAIAAIGSSAVFGLWHIAPTAVSLELNGIAAGSPEGMATIAAGVAVTTAAGFVFTWLRWRSGSLLAPVLAHWATNALGLLAAATSRPLT